MKKIIPVLLLFLSSCYFFTKNEDMNGFDVRLFRDSPVWEIAKAVEDENVDKIKRLLKNKPESILNYQEKKFGYSLINWAVFNNHFPSVKALTELGADVNLQMEDGTSAFIQGCSKYETSEYAKLLLKFGGNPNDIARCGERAQILRTPLQAAAVRFETFKLLLDSGADAGYVYPGYGTKSALEACLISNNLDAIEYLIFNLDVDYKSTFNKSFSDTDINILTYLRNYTYPLDSEEYKRKMKLVTFLKKNGMDYWKAPIPTIYYQNYDSTYLSKY